MNTIDDMLDEMDFFHHCKNFSEKIDDALLVFVVLISNVCLYEIYYNISSSIKNLHTAKKNNIKL